MSGRHRSCCGAGAPASTPAGMRLVKGAYWDTEIKRAQEGGACRLPGFYTQSYHRSLLSCPPRAKCWPAASTLNNAGLYPQFGTHNAYTVAAIQDMAAHDFPGRIYEFQRLHGMGAELYQSLGPERACAYTPRSGRNATCWPIWFGACWRTGQTLPSSPRSVMVPFRLGQLTDFTGSRSARAFIWRRGTVFRMRRCAPDRALSACGWPTPRHRFRRPRKLGAAACGGKNDRACAAFARRDTG